MTSPLKDQTDKLRELDRRVSVLEIQRKEREDQLASLEKLIAYLSSETDILEKSEQTLLHISTRILGQSTTLIEKLVTAGLRLVFDDQKLEFRTITEKYRGKTAIKFQLLEDGRTAPLMDAFGGGVLVVVGVLLRATTIMVLGLRRVLFLDETFSHVSSMYIPNVSKLLAKLADELDFTIVMVTHQPEFAEYATKHYNAVRKDGVTTFHKESERKPDESEAVQRLQ